MAGMNSFGWKVCAWCQLFKFLPHKADEQPAWRMNTFDYIDSYVTHSSHGSKRKQQQQQQYITDKTLFVLLYNWVCVCVCVCACVCVCVCVLAHIHASTCASWQKAFVLWSQSCTHILSWYTGESMHNNICMSAPSISWGHQTYQLTTVISVIIKYELSWACWKQNVLLYAYAHLHVYTHLSFLTWDLQWKLITENNSTNAHVRHQHYRK